MDLGLDGRAALVLGGSRGLGRACALELLREGASVMVSARDENRLATVTADLARDGERLSRRAGDRLDPVTADDADIWLEDGPRRSRLPAPQRVAFVAADLADPEAPERIVDATVRRFGRLDVLVVNAGGPPPGPFGAVTEEQWDHAVQVSLRSAIRLVRAALPHLRSTTVRAAGGGRIVFLVGSAATHPIPNLVTSNTIRPGVVGLMKTLSVELAPDGILVNAVAPAHLATDRDAELDADDAARTGRRLEEVRAARVASIPIGRIGDPAELAAVVAFLASTRASYVTGVLLPVDGGSTPALP